MPRSLVSSLFGLTLALTAAGTPGAQAPAASGARRTVDFATDIHPILEAKCLGCHGEKLQLSKLDLRTRESAIDGGAHGPALVPGKAEQSRLYRHVAGLEEPAMPMRGEALTAAEIDTLKRWIDGAPAGTPAPRRPPRRARRRWPPSKTGRSPTRNAATGRSSCRCRRRSRSCQPRLRPSHRSLPRAGARRARAHGGAARRSPHAGPPRLSRSARPAAVARPRSTRFVADTRPDAWERLDRHAARVAALRRALRPALARRRPLRRLGRLRARRPPPQRLALSRLRHPCVQRTTSRTTCSSPSRSPATRWTARPTRRLIATGFLRAGPRVLFREKDNPERRFDYLDDVHRRRSARARWD